MPIKLHQLIDNMVPDQEFAVIAVSDDGVEHPIYAGDGCDDEWDEIYPTIWNRTVCNFQAYRDLIFIIL